MSKVDHCKIVEYDNTSPDKYLSIKDFILNSINISPLDVEHVGSSSVSGLGGKRVIDVLLVTLKEKTFEVVKKLQTIGYKFNPERGAGTFDDRYFISGDFKYNNQMIHVHYHITYRESKEYENKIKFRNYLIKHKAEADNYYKLKIKWMEQANKDLIKFAELKSPYIKNILENKI